MNPEIYKIKDFSLESGAVIEDLNLAYHTFGKLNKSENNVVWVFHALTANSNVFEWWKGLFGENDIFNPRDYYIICVNVIGSPYGSSAPFSLDFPEFTVRDVVRAQIQLAKKLDIDKIKVAIGGSFGGSQALEFALTFKGEIDKLIVIACAAQESAWGKAIHHAQRLALLSDSTFGSINGGKKGLKTARAIGLLTYRNSDTFNNTQADKGDELDENNAASYLDYQGDKFVNRFNALSYYYLHKCLDTHNVGRKRGGIKETLNRLSVETLAIGINTDQLIPTNLQKQIVELVPNSCYKEIISSFGHDGFLIETKQLTIETQKFINK